MATTQEMIETYFNANQTKLDNCVNTVMEEYKKSLGGKPANFEADLDAIVNLAYKTWCATTLADLLKSQGEESFSTLSALERQSELDKAQPKLKIKDTLRDKIKQKTPAPKVIQPDVKRPVKQQPKHPDPNLPPIPVVSAKSQEPPVGITPQESPTAAASQEVPPAKSQEPPVGITPQESPTAAASQELPAAASQEVPSAAAQESPAPESPVLEPVKEPAQQALPQQPPSVSVEQALATAKSFLDEYEPKNAITSILRDTLERSIQATVSEKSSRTWDSSTDTGTVFKKLQTWINLKGPKGLTITKAELDPILNGLKPQIEIMGAGLSKNISQEQIDNVTRREQARNSRELEREEALKKEAIRIAAAPPPLPGDEEMARRIQAEGEGAIDEDEALARALASEEEPRPAVIPGTERDEQIARELAASEEGPRRRAAPPIPRMNDMDEDAELARALAESEAHQDLRRPLTNPNNDEDADLKRAIEASKIDADKQARMKQKPAAPKQPIKNNTPPVSKPVQPVAPLKPPADPAPNLTTPPADPADPADPAPKPIPTQTTPLPPVQPNPTPAQPGTNTGLIQLGIYINELKSKSLHEGTSYGRSNQVEKQKIANAAQKLLNDTTLSDKEKLIQIQTHIRANRKATGIPFLHDHPGDLASILKVAEKELIDRVKVQPYQLPLAQLDSYINAAKENENNLNKGSKIGSFVIKSNQVDKFGLALTVRNTCAALNNTTSLADLEKISAQLELYTTKNAELTGSNFLHKKGQLHDILESLTKQVKTKIAELKPAAPKASL